MATDTERREVAERLRSLAGGYVTIGEVEEALGVRVSPPRVDLDRDARNLSRLADLIDPDCDEGRYEGVRTARPVDRGALLALADECESVHMHKVARRIREALGVVA